MILQHFWWILKQKSLRLGRNLWTLNHSRKTFLLCWQIMRNCVIIWKRLSLLRCDCTFVWWVKVKNNVFVFFFTRCQRLCFGHDTWYVYYLFTFSFYVFFFSWYVYVLGTYLNVISFVYTLFGRKRPKDKSYEKKLKSEHKSTLKAANWTGMMVKH